MAMNSPSWWLPLTFTSLVIIWACRKVTWKTGDCRANAGERLGKTQTPTARQPHNHNFSSLIMLAVTAGAFLLGNLGRH
jgi:hypothetical protein